MGGALGENCNTVYTVNTLLVHVYCVATVLNEFIFININLHE
jgi:hypothetical protein